MAYAQSAVTASDRLIRGRRHYRFTWTETDVAAGSEWSVAGVPVSGVIALLVYGITGGSAVTLQPSVTKAAGAASTSNNHVGQVTIPRYNDADASGLHYDGSTGTLYGKSNPDAATNTTTAYEMTIIEGQD